ncbi:MAG: V-type ATP synthase subunit F [Thermodesulfovibrionales bacterium]|nr:V-type ATP synthase subunit F [Thermodesulfovibrionales bacterium]
MKKIIFITPEDAEPGFSLAGVIHHSVKPEECERLLKDLISDPETGLIAVDERLVNAMGQDKFKKIEEKFSGVMVIIPSPEKPEEREDYLLRLIRRAIGYHVRLRI